MRLDKFIKISRLLKRRTAANELCSAGGVTINGKVAKPSSEVREGDILTLDLGHHQITVRIASVPLKAPPAQSASSLYTVVSETYNEPSQ